MTYPSDYTNQDAKALELARLAAPLLATCTSPYTETEVRAAVRYAQRLLAESARVVAEGAKLAAMADEARDEHRAQAMGGVEHAHRMVCERLGVCYCPTKRSVPTKADAPTPSAVSDAELRAAVLAWWNNGIGGALGADGNEYDHTLADLGRQLAQEAR